MRMNKQTIDYEKTFANDISHKICKELSKINNKTIQ